MRERERSEISKGGGQDSERGCKDNEREGARIQRKRGCTGFSSQIWTKLRDWAVGQAWGSYYSWAALSSNDSKTLYRDGLNGAFWVP